MIRFSLLTAALLCVRLFALDMDRLKVEAENIRTVALHGGKLKMLKKLFHKALVNEKTKDVLAVCSMAKWDHECLWKNGMESIDFQYAIQPVKEKPFYIVTGGYGTAALNLDTGFYKKTKGKFIAFQDLDGDDLPEIITLDDRSYAHRKFYAYKILDAKKSPSIGVFTSNPVLPDAYVQTPGRCDVYDRFEYMPVRYDKEEGLILPDKVVKKHFKSKQACEKAFAAFIYGRWSAESLAIETTWRRFDKDSVMYTAKKLGVNELDILHLDKYMSRRSVCYRIDKKLEIKNLMLCEAGKGVYKSPKRDLTAIMDMGNERRGLHYANNTIDKQPAQFFASDRYLVVRDAQTGKVRWFEWAKVLGHAPLMIAYCDGQILVTVSGNPHGDKKVDLYSLRYGSAKVVETTW